MGASVMCYGTVTSISLEQSSFPIFDVPICFNATGNSHFRIPGGKHHNGTGFRQVLHQHGVQFNLRVLQRTFSNCYQVLLLIGFSPV